MKKQIVCMFFVVLFSNVCKTMVNPYTIIYLLQEGNDPNASAVKIQLPSQEIIAQHLNSPQFGNLESKNFSTLSQKLSGKYTSRFAIQCCSQHIIQDDPLYKTLPIDEKSALLRKITDAIVSLALVSSPQSSFFSPSQDKKSTSSSSASSSWKSLSSSSSSSS